MNPVTLRRLLVLGVCAVGVGALYVVPALADPSGEFAAPLPDDGPTSLPTGSATSTSRGGPTSGTTRTRPGASSADLTSSAASTQDAAVKTVRPIRLASSGATAYDPRTDTDHVAPTSVATITTAAVTRDRITVSWPAATDDVGVQRYRVVLNGFTVATTRKTHVTVRWFNDDLGSHVIQVRALDAAGNESISSPNLLVSRPASNPTPAPSPSATPTAPSPTPSATPSDPSPSATLTPNEVEEPVGASSPSPSPAAAAASASPSGGS